MGKRTTAVGTAKVVSVFGDENEMLESIHLRHGLSHDEAESIQARLLEQAQLDNESDYATQASLYN